MNNLMYNSRAPALVVYAASEADVVAAVRFAAQRRLPLCVRSGGHDSTGASICDRGMVLDVSQMNQVGAGGGLAGVGWRCCRRRRRCH